MKKVISVCSLFIIPVIASASEASLVVPESMKSVNWLYWGFLITILGLIFSFWQYKKVVKQRAHESMLDVANVIYQTGKTYLIQQGKFLIILFLIVGSVIAFYFGYLSEPRFSFGNVLFILMWTLIGILGSYSVAWFGIRVNTLANSRMAFASLENKPFKLFNIPMQAGMSIGMMLISLELMIMLFILMVLPGELAGASFIGFAIGESLGASVLRIAGGIFTKIADIGSDLMKVIFKIGEDDPRNPGTIADCTGDNAGDSVGPTADGFETYGVTGVALITFILLAVDGINNQVQFLAWIFGIRLTMIIASLLGYYINNAISNKTFGKSKEVDFEKPLMSLIVITSIISIAMTFLVSYLILGANYPRLWVGLSIIVSLGTLAALIIPELTKFSVSPKSKHTKVVMESSKRGGASLNILSGIVSGYYSAFYHGLAIAILMFLGYLTTQSFGLSAYMIYPVVFSFGLIAFGMLGMGPVTIAVDSYGPVTDNAQSIYELSLIEEIPNIEQEIEKDFNFKPNFDDAKHYLESNDGAGNTFKATAKPVLIGTAVVGATTMIFSIILVIKNTLGIDPAQILNILNPFTILGFLLGGSVIYWFSGAANHAVNIGAGKAVNYIKQHIQLDPNAPKKASTKTSKEVVRICTIYAQNGMINIFIAIFSFALAFAFFSSPAYDINAVSFFISYLISIAFFGLMQAVFMANAGAAWDNAKKIVEVDMKQKGTPLHDATIIGDTVGDPFKDTASVSLNPIIKFTTLFGLLAMEIAISDGFKYIAPYIGIVFLIIALFFALRSFFGLKVTN
ncbi:MAG: sodium-translocating pyrophosphatase [Bacteroidales bacterium]|jgi:K(+)-stimulated pyrophosphate-energized sodium pump|nr:sodium-translocating pyrophosphatase [Bacteroidales bacterium]MDI9574846.1 sodium-translocating pyrophosphatase [Bacteroidota bacterium]MDY0401225.1 sodium-translocating pyrophosphatase [Bacteroidales bacterium]HHW58929.1 sodium-translocating pyrophosphatase [Bacteroidales bacterium]HOB77870.1 sodium-translocating pyrophosphatase [Bacteroidales bacterium]